MLHVMCAKGYYALVITLSDFLEFIYDTPLASRMPDAGRTVQRACPSVQLVVTRRLTRRRTGAVRSFFRADEDDHPASRLLPGSQALSRDPTGRSEPEAPSPGLIHCAAAAAGHLRVRGPLVKKL
jgi:hypothetical protein